jgi:hypothetical protein
MRLPELAPGASRGTLTRPSMTGPYRTPVGEGAQPRGIRAQARLFGIGFCMSACGNDAQCLFDCLAFERAPFRPFPGRY